MQGDAETARKRMIDRKLNCDADDEEEKHTSPKGHGNTHLPYGLCKSQGIELPDNATPTDAWDALAGKGIYPKDVFKYMDVYGTAKGYTPENTPKNTPTNTPSDSPINNPVNNPTDTPSDTPKNIPEDKPVDTPKDVTDDMKTDEQTKKDFKEYRAGIRQMYDKMKELLESGDYDKDKVWSIKPNVSQTLKDLDKQMQGWTGEAGHDPDTRRIYYSTLQMRYAVNGMLECYSDVKNLRKSAENGDDPDWVEWEKKEADEHLARVKDAIDGISQEVDPDVKEYLTQKYNEAKTQADNVLSEVKEAKKKAADEKKKAIEDKASQIKKQREADETKRSATRGQKRKTGIKQHEHFDSVSGVVQNLGKTLGAVSVSFEGVLGLDVPGMGGGDKFVDKANKISDALLTMKENYGIVPVRVAHGNRKDVKHNGKGCVEAYWSFGQEKGSLFLMDLRWTDDGANKASDNKFDRWNVDDSTEALIVHEIGHGLMNSKANPFKTDVYEKWDATYAEYKKKYASKLKSGKITADDLNDLVQAELENSEPSLFNLQKDKKSRLLTSVCRAYDKAVRTGDVYKLSEYGAADKDEFFAETFSAYVKGEDMPDYMVDMVEDFI